MSTAYLKVDIQVIKTAITAYSPDGIKDLCKTIAANLQYINYSIGCVHLVVNSKQNYNIAKFLTFHKCNQSSRHRRSK